MPSSRFTIAAAILAAAAATVSASVVPVSERADGVTPTAPGPGDVFRQGGTCTTSWTPDTSGTWTNFTIDLMTGSNFAMTKLATVASGLDGTSTSKTSLAYPCPDVSPNSAIYFYQYTLADGSSPTWTTRWAIADASGNTTPEQHKTQTDGSAIPWGKGKLLSTVSGGDASGSSASSSSSNSGSASSSSAAPASTSAASQTSSMQTVVASTSSSSAPSSSQSSDSSNSSSSSPSSSSSSSGSSSNLSTSSASRNTVFTAAGALVLAAASAAFVAA